VKYIDKAYKKIIENENYSLFWALEGHFMLMEEPGDVVLPLWGSGVG
jgi:hypothetical protein